FGPAGEMMASARAGAVPSFLIECTTPRGMWMKSPTLAWIVCPPAWKRGAALQDIKGFILKVVKMRRRASAGRKDSIHDEAAAVGFLARDQKANPITRPAIH